MDALDVAILALRLALVLLLYLFLAVVVRLAARGLNASAQPVRPARPLPQAATELQLIVEQPAASSLPPGRVILVRDGMTLGRADAAGVVLADPTVSAEHARIARQGSAWTITDLRSTNGTLLNQHRVDGEAPLSVGDVLALGNVQLRVVAT